MGKHQGPQFCFCTYYDCAGNVVSGEDWVLHNELSKSAQVQALESEVAWMVLTDPQPPDRRTPATRAPACNTPSKPATFPAASTSGTTPNIAPTSTTKEVFRALYRLDVTVHQHFEQIQEVIAEWSHSSRIATSLHPPPRFLTQKEAHQFLAKETDWLREVAARVKAVQVSLDEANRLLQRVIVEKADNARLAVWNILQAWETEEENTRSSPDFFDTGKWSLHDTQTVTLTQA
jgi:hypothetical protein